MNRIISLFFAASLLAACGQGTKKQGALSREEAIPISVNEFLSDAGPLVDQPVMISGTVVHVCRHGGQRLFIVGEDGQERIRITTGNDIAEFDIELEGETVEVIGIVRELIIDETYLAEWEAEVMDGSTMDRGEGHEGGVGHGDGHVGSPPSNLEQPETGDQPATAEPAGEATDETESQLARIQQVRDEIAQSGKDHLSDFWIETVEFKVIKE